MNYTKYGCVKDLGEGLMRKRALFIGIKLIAEKYQRQSFPKFPNCFTVYVYIRAKRLKHELFALKGRNKGKKLLTPSSPRLQKLNNSEPVP